MIFIVNESVFSGTVTIDSLFSGIEAETFEKAVEKLKANFSEKVTILHEDERSITFSVKQDNILKVRGIMRNEPLKIT